jgi:hypothetical protein
MVERKTFPDSEILLEKCVEFTADNGLNVVLLRLFEEAWDGKDIAMIRHGDGRHSELVHMLEEPIDATGPIQETVIGMDMKVDEVFLHDGVLKSKRILGKAAERSRALPGMERKLSADL